MAYLSLILFTIATTGTPGPNNIMIMASGRNYGLRRSAPHVAGINIGFPLMVIVLGMTLSGVLAAAPVIYPALRPIAVAYLLYLAYRIATAPSTHEQEGAAQPLSAVQAALFQAVNPKAWAMIVGAVATYTTADGNHPVQVLVIALIFLVFGTPCTVAWLVFGTFLARVVARPSHVRLFNYAMAALLVLSLVPVLIDIGTDIAHLLD